MCDNCADSSKPYDGGPTAAGPSASTEDWPLIEFEDDGSVRWAGP